MAGAAVWLSFLIAGAIAGMQGYSLARFGARYPSAGGMLEDVVRAFGNGHFTGVIAWLLLATNAIITGMVAVSFGSYASAAVADENEAWAKAFAVLIVLVMALLNVLESQAVARAQTVVVVVVVGILGVFAATTLANIDVDLLAFSGYPPFGDIVSSVALTFFAFLGFGVIAFTARDLADPRRQLPRAVYLALGIATVIYVAVALGVFGTLTVVGVAIIRIGRARCAGPRPSWAGCWLLPVVTLDGVEGVVMFGHGDKPVPELEALLSGTYVEYLERRRYPVPPWAWINLLAHGSEDELRSAARARPRPFLNVNVWRHARSYLAGEVLEAAGRTGSLVVLQAAVLVPRELADLATPPSRRIRPGRWACGVLTAVEDYQRVTRRPPS